MGVCIISTYAMFLDGQLPTTVCLQFHLRSLLGLSCAGQTCVFMIMLSLSKMEEKKAAKLHRIYIICSQKNKAVSKRML